MTPSELEYCIDLFNGEAAPAQTFQWGCSARSVRIDGPRLLADDGPEKVGAALSMEACANGAHSWTLRRINNSRLCSDYIGVCIGTGIHLGSSPTSSTFNSFVVGFRATAGVGGDLRYKSNGLLLEYWQKGKHGFLTLEEEGSVLEITLDQEAGTVTFRAPELCNPLCLLSLVFHYACFVLLCVAMLCYALL